MDTFHTPPEWFNSFWVAINQPKLDGKSQVTSDAKRAPPKPGKKHRNTTQSDEPKERPGLSAVKILRQLMMTISLKDLCTESPKFRQKLHQAISALRPGKYEALFLTGTVAPRTTGTVNGIHTSIILDGGAYSNIISKMFLESLPWPEVTSSDVSFILANESCKTALGKAIRLRLWLGGVFNVIKAVIFDHDQYTLLLGRKTMSSLSVTTWFADNSWTLEHNDELIDLKVTFDSPTGPSFLCKPLAAQIKDNTWLNNVQQDQLHKVISTYSSHIVSDYDNLPKAPGFRHKIDTGNTKPVASWFYRLPQSREEFVRTKILKLLKQGMIRPSKSPWASPIVVVPKKGNKLHMCVNYIPLNKVTISDHYPLPRISDILASFGVHSGSQTLTFSVGSTRSFLKKLTS
ncbi:hypothetical protein DSO57_1039726 [Entomophthora muscae]|uniref:Uncharacterized protein n=1 Tax=Entomophthora muscae TaxID=34485 RepID=A0ACC2SLM2_9FUNG|nr:hypothetical protein DSO57_1039726 [Entomophthora muscae]